MSPLIATILFTIAAIAGVNYRRLWKAEAESWKLWTSGLIAAICLLTVAFAPLSGVY